MFFLFSYHFYVYFLNYYLSFIYSYFHFHVSFMFHFQFVKSLRSRGMKGNDAEQLVALASHHANLYLDAKHAFSGKNMDKLDQDPGLLLDSILLLLSYNLSGFLVISPYLLPLPSLTSLKDLFLLSSSITVTLLIILSIYRKSFAYSSWISCFLESFLSISASAVVSYCLGFMLIRQIEDDAMYQ